ncbi:MAG: PEGA domain-containing protein [Myxococcota bacterium]|nr:PEGA domain-containing protein [Myxococcota bacterium]
MKRAFRLHHLAFALLLTVLHGGLLGSTALAGKQKIAILGIEATVGASGQIEPADTQVAKELTAAFRARANASTGFTLTTDNRELVDEKLMNNCATEHPSCMGPIGNQMGAEVLMFGKLESTKDGYKVTLKLISVAKRQQLGVLPNELLPAAQIKGAALANWARSAFKKLTGEESDGTVVIKVGNAERGTVLVNGEPKGNLSSGTATITLPEGRYRIGVEADGFRLWEEKDVTVRSGEATERKSIELVASSTGGGGLVTDPDPDAGLKGRENTVSSRKSKTVFKVAAAAALGGAAITGAVWGVSYFGAIRTYENAKLTSDMEPMRVNGVVSNASCGKGEYSKPEDQEKFANACSAYARTKWAVPTTIGLAAVGIGALVYVLVSKDDSEAPAAMAGRRVNKRQFAVSPVVSPDGAGATLQFDW